MEGLPLIRLPLAVWLSAILAGSLVATLLPANAQVASTLAPMAGPGGGSQALGSPLYNRSLNPLSRLAGPSGGRASSAGWRAYTSSLNPEARPRNIQFGPVAFTVNTGVSFTYDSNINGSATDPLADFIVEPHISLGFFWPITRRNELALSLGLSYQYYATHPEYASSGFTLDPSTGLEFRMYTGDFVITVYDSPSITTNPPGGDPALENTGYLREFQNSIGISILWDWNKLVTVTGLERGDSLSLNGNFSNLNQTSYSAFLQTLYTVTPTTSVGFRVSASANDFTSNALNNSIVSFYGLLLQSRLTNYTSLYLEAGLQSGIYSDNAPVTSQPAFVEDSEGFNSNIDGTLGGGNFLQPYFRLGLTNQLNRFLNHNLFLSREAQASSVSNYREEYALSYQLSYRLNRITTLYAGGEIAYGQVSSSGTEQFPFYQWGTRLAASFDIMRDVSLGLSYEYFVNNYGDAPNSTYNRQRVSLNVNWSF